MSKHTPGPWTISYCQIMGKPSGIEEPIGIADVKNRDMDANARLIAAAPDLLEAAKAIMNSNRGEHLPAEKVGKMMEAIAKAEGEAK